MIFCLYKIFYCDKGTKLLKGYCLKVEERYIKKRKKNEDSKISKKSGFIPRVIIIEGKLANSRRN